jgi:hypothetical protein
MSPIDEPAPSTPPIRPADATDVAWIDDFLRERWGATAVAVHDEVIDAAQLPALIAEPRRGLTTYRRLGGDAELVTLDAAPPGSGTGTAFGRSVDEEAQRRRLRSAVADDDQRQSVGTAILSAPRLPAK